MKHTRLEIKQILNLFVVDFSVRGFNGIFAFVLFDFFPELLDCPWNDTLSFIGFVDFTVVDLVFSSHGVGFSWTSLAICKNCGTVAFYGCIDQLIDITLFVAHFLGIILIEKVVEFVAFINTSWWLRKSTCGWFARYRHFTTSNSSNLCGFFRFSSWVLL